MARKREVMLADGIHWFALPKAAAHIGLTKKELTALALEDGVRWSPDDFGQPGWIAEPDLVERRKAHLEAERERAAKKAARIKRPLTDAQVNARNRHKIKLDDYADIGTRRGGGGGTGSLHALRLNVPSEPMPERPQLPGDIERRKKLLGEGEG
jgi:hypothetical protein